MNNSRPSAYTALESLFLFQLLSKYGFIDGSFDRIAQELKSTPLILEQTEYDAGRLTPEALQQLALQLLSEEQKREAEAVAEKGANGLSPTSKKRKLQNPPLPTLKEAHEHPEKLPILVDRLYARFRDELVRQIREDERLYQQREREIDEIEQGEWDERIRQEQRADTASNGTPTEKNIHATPTPVPVQVPAQVPVQVPVQAPVQISAPVQPRPQEPTNRVEATPLSVVPTPPPSQVLHEKRPLQPCPSPLAPVTAPAPAPASVPAPPIATTTAMRSASEQRPFATDVRPPQESARVSNGTTPVLQHPQMAPGYVPRPPSTAPSPSQLHVPDGAPRPESLPKAKSPVPTQQGQAQAPPLKWEPLYQPPHHPPHHPPHQTPVPSPRPPYTSGTSRPQGYPHVPPGLPQASQHPQHAQNYAGGRQTPGQSVPQPRFPTPGTSAPSPPVLLPPQNAGPIPPSLQSLPVNATPDGTGQHGLHHRPSSTPVVASPTPSVPRNAYAQHQTTGLPTPTPVRPPSGLVPTQPAVATTKPSTQIIQSPQPPTSIRHPPAQSQPRPQPSSQQPPVPTTPSQPQHPKAAQRSYGASYNQQPKPVVVPDIVPRSQALIQTPLSTPQASRVNDALYVIRGHGTKWTSTPTPSTPRIKDAGSYFDIESPAFEPISPPARPARLPTTPIIKTDVSKPRNRAPRVAQKAGIVSESGGNEEATPQTLQEAMDTAANETLPGRTPAAMNSLPNKRKRQDSPPHRGPPTPTTHVLWTRAFHKISMTALDQIIGHRLAPGYYDIILRPQDLKAAAATVATMPEVDANSPAVWLPISIDLVPPRGIINIAQLERELIHMFANAIMYNPDPQRGLGPSFLRSYQSNSEEGEDLRGYEFDENGVVKDTRNMFAEVEKLLGDLRSRSVSAAVGESNTRRRIRG
ncbi:hypothetical protein F5Y12DRAFT_784552 [Xylaria sp. FL1777]|nr:hypothetical protein F5Y12DRAFT_784552 [Xylaria sp. FL1777]